MGTFPKGFFKDKVVLVGPKYLSSSDDFLYTPFGKEEVKAPKMFLHANIINALTFDKTILKVPELISDFLALIEEKTESRLAGDIYTITRNTMLTDDFAQAVNLGACAIWHSEGAWPNYAEAAAIGRVTTGQIIAAGNADYGWNEDRSNFFSQP